MQESEQTTYPPHPYAFPDNRSGAMGVRAGERFVRLTDGRRGRLDEALPDGEAFVTWDDGTHDTIKWGRIAPEKRNERA